MGILRDHRSGRIFCMGSQALVGRGPECDLQLDNRLVSSPHALLRWTSEGWAARDIGSRNGTWLADQRLEPGREVRVPQGAQLCFGDRSRPWELLSDAPPGPAARAEDGATATATDGLLALPDASRPELVLLPESGSWLIERDDDLAPASDGQIVEVEGRRWTLSLPRTPVHAPAASTLDVSSDAPDQALLVFSVSQDEEHVDVEVIGPGGRLSLSARNHHFVLLALARAREADARQGATEAERGWLYQDDLCRMLALDPQLLALHLFRAREQVAAAGLPFATRLIERRRLSRQVRLGPLRVEVRPSGGA